VVLRLLEVSVSILLSLLLLRVYVSIIVQIIEISHRSFFYYIIIVFDYMTFYTLIANYSSVKCLLFRFFFAVAGSSNFPFIARATKEGSRALP
jgi:hypothetical protein